MKALSIAAVACAALVVPATAQPMDHADHRLVRADQVQWAAGPASLPPGAEAALLYGDPSREGMFVLRVRMPDGYRIPPHTHPRPEIVTVVAGTFRIGMGADGALSPLPAGSFFAFPPGMIHHAKAEGETVVQISSTGPWDISYVDPADDPRRGR